MAQFIKPKSLSVVVPVRNEEDNVAELIFEIRKSLKNKIKTYIDISMDANVYQKSIVFPDQRNVYILSPSIRKVFTKSDAWELKLYVFDLLNQNTNVSRNISSNFISEQTNNGIRKYFLLGVVYNFSKNGKPSSMGF